MRGENRQEKHVKISYKNQRLKKHKLAQQLKKWVEYGTIENSVQLAIKEFIDDSNRLDLSDKYFVLFGAGSAMGPFETLISFGANIIAIDINRANIWKRLIKKTKRSSGNLYFPTSTPQQSNSSKLLSEISGCNLLTDTIEIAHWLHKLCSSIIPSDLPDRSITVGSYVYLDGEKHVRLVMSCDAICIFLTNLNWKINFAYLCTPTDCHPIPEEARDNSIQQYNQNSLSNLILSPVKVIGGGRWLKKNMNIDPIHGKTYSGEDKDYFIVNAIVSRQGPNYILAKRIQHWRAIYARANGFLVSTNIAPSTSTSSVVHQRSFAWAYDGMPFFPPMEIFDEKTSCQLMAILLMHDIQNPESKANPNNALDHPMELFSDCAVHGGIWRMAYTMDSITEPSAAIHFVKVFANSRLTKFGCFILLSAVGYKISSKL